MGICSIVAYMVGQRTPEIGIRLALGATTADVLGMIAREGLRPVAAGLALGVAGVLALGRLASQLYGVSALDPSTLAAAAATLAVIALLACVVPARRAMPIEPAIALKHG